LLAAAWTWPLPLHAANRFAHDPGDPLLNTFILWWDAHSVPLTASMWSAPFYWPMRDALALTEHLAGIALITSPIQWLGGSALLAYNLVLIASTWLAGLAVHLLVRRIIRVHPCASLPSTRVPAEAGAWCAGVVWALAPYRASQLAHIQVLVTWWMPVALLALHAYYEDGRRRWLALFGGAWLVQSLSNGYYMFFLPVLVAGWLAAFTRWRSQWRRAAAVVAAWAICSLPLIPVLLEYYRVQRALGLFRTRTEMQLFSATWSSFVHYSPLLRFWPFHEPRTQEEFLFPGLASLVAIVAAVALRRRAALRRRGLRDRLRRRLDRADAARRTAAAVRRRDGPRRPRARTAGGRRHDQRGGDVSRYPARTARRERLRRLRAAAHVGDRLGAAPPRSVDPD
jgi:hypothetical protein